VVEIERRGIWSTVPLSEQTAEMRAEARKATVETLVVPARNLDEAHLDALEANFARDHYIDGSNPRRFTLEGKTLDSGTFAIEMFHLFARQGTIRSYYKRLDDALILAGKRVKAFATRRSYRKTGDRVGSMPKAIAELEGYR
jgi:hypothetical protein